MIYIEARYQYWGADGIIWTKWYKHKKYNTMDEAKSDLLNLETNSKKHKLQSEFKIVKDI